MQLPVNYSLRQNSSGLPRFDSPDIIARGQTADGNHKSQSLGTQRRHDHVLDNATDAALQSKSILDAMGCYTDMEDLPNVFHEVLPGSDEVAMDVEPDWSTSANFYGIPQSYSLDIS